ncbi:hypothetical protein [Streptacidiphilus rugosus]|uniref:hypothetical protein n=1 Tax=Streptacidiphilus rugosus TaxID=405783 RepID=UPI0005678651|nr:hypothetical protein [Streptacidiphilus rugosus]
MGLFDAPAESPPGEDELGPRPPRSRRGLWWQFWFQWTYLLVGSVLILAVAGLLLWLAALGGDVGGVGGGGGSGSQNRIGGSVLLTRRQYLLERDGGPDAWAARVQEALRLGTQRADRRRAEQERRRAKALAKGGTPPPLGPDRLQLTLPVHRGAGLGVVADLAAAFGWELDWKPTRTARLETAHLVRRSPGGAEAEPVRGN